MSQEKLEPTGQSILNICDKSDKVIKKPNIGEFKGNKKLIL